MAEKKANLAFIFIALTIAPILHQANAINFVDQWCARTNHNALCCSIVYSDQRANLKTSPNGITTIFRDNAVATAIQIIQTSAKISRLLRIARNGHEIASLKSCSEGYVSAISSLRFVDFRVIDRARYGTLVGAISNANDVPRDCELSFEEPPAVPLPIAAENERLREISATTLESVNVQVFNSPSFLFSFMK